MRKKARSISEEISPLKVRLIAAVLLIGMVLIGLVAIFAIAYDMLPVYERLLRNAPVVEVRYLVFEMPIIPPAALFISAICIYCICTGKKFDPKTGTAVDDYCISAFKFFIKGSIGLVPALVFSATLWLLVSGYSTCRALNISGASGKVYWVNDSRVCFKPDHYSEDNWPCRVVDGSPECIRIDGR